MSQLLVKNLLKNHFSTQILTDLDVDSLKNEKDVISEAYEKIVDKGKRKKHAQFFTHKELVNFILLNVPITNKSKILDPSCGTGAFLIEAYTRNGHKIDNLYGMDIDNAALKLCSTNLKEKSQANTLHLKNTNTLKNSLSKIFPEVAAEGGFDIIVGNPPFQNLNKNVDFFEDDSIYKEVLSGVANSATLMIAKSYEFLKEGGYLGFVLPKNIIRVDSFNVLRKFLINNTRLVCIYDIDHYFKDVRCDQIILIFQKKKLSSEEIKDNKVKILVYKKNLDFNTPYSYELSQSVFSKYDFYPIFYHKEVFPLAERFFSFNSTLENVTNGEIFRGITISTNSPIISKNQIKNTIKILRGDSIQRFGKKYNLFIDLRGLNGQQKDKLYRLKTKKIVLQNLCSKEGGIFATISGSDELSLDTVTNIISKDVPLEYLLGILNSKISNFFITFVIFLNSNFTMHTDKKYIGQIPIVIPEKIKIDEIVKIVSKLQNIKDKYSSEFFEYYDLLNVKLYDIYGLNEKEKEIINRLLKEVMSKRQNGRKNE